MNALLLCLLPALSPCSASGQLELRLALDRDRFLVGEPIRLSVQLRNPGRSDVTIEHPADGEAGRLELRRIGEDGSAQSLDARGLAMRFFCFTGEDLSAPRSWSIAAGATHEERLWHQDPLPPGAHRLQAVFIPLHGPSRGLESRSRPVRVTIVAPAGADAAAAEWIFRDGMIDTAEGKYSASFLKRALIRSGNKLPPPLLAAFMQQHARSRYADYIRYTTLPHDYQSEPSKRIELLRAFLDGAPDELPVLADAYVDLLRCLKSELCYEEMARASRECRRREVATGSAVLGRILEQLLDEVPRWPPTDPARKQRARAAQEVWASRRVAEAHWLTRALHERYGRAAASETGARRVSRTFDDPSSGRPVVVRFRFAEAGELEELRISGSPSSLLIAELRPGIEQLIRSLGQERARAAFLDASLGAASLSGELRLADGSRLAFEHEL